MSAIPLVVARDIAAKTITDVTWDPSGQLLFLSSLDGSVTAVFFDEGELGKPIPLEQNSAQLHRYGADRESMYFPESVEQLKLEDAAKAFIQEHPVHSRMEKLMGQLTEGQQQQGLNEINASTTTSTTSVNTLIPRSKKHPDRKLPVTILQTRPKPAAVLTAATQTVRITKSGKKRVTPTLVSVTGNIAAKPQFGNQVIQKRQTKMAQRFLSRPSIKIPRQGLQTLVASVRDSLIWEKQQGKDDESESTIDHISEAQISNGKKHSLPKTQSSRKKRATEFPTYLRSSITTPFSVFTDMKAQPSVIIEEKSSEDGTPFGSIMEIRNECEDKVVNGEFFEEFDSIAKLFVTDGLSENPMFEFFKNEKVTNVTESEFTRESIKVDYWAISTEKGSIILLSKTGRQLMPSLELGSSLTHLISKGKYVLAVTSNGLVYSWDIDIQKSVMEGISLAPLVNQFASYDSHRRKFENAVRIVELRLVDRGLPLVVLSNRHAFSFDVALECWISVLEPWYFDKLGSKDVEEGLKFASGALRIIGGRLRKKQIDKVDENREVVKRAFVEIERCVSERTVR
ncbi:DEKNAAC103316 [Brettanomyces naardenensis]|uniref:DEKNAAC103316 n=1 Tax=Brettanomyces naardenensis TaxID=13370 RepID=A0A448YND3_BRENA|nr:DEKNAAC103316 [Brettanomyces naardenensis]